MTPHRSDPQWRVREHERERLSMENTYDDPEFFKRYSAMPRSEQGLAAAGEWPQLRAMLPPLAGRRVLDIGCGMGWHCRHAATQGAVRVLGIDVSRRMLDEAEKRSSHNAIEYRLSSIEEMDVSAGSFDVVISSLALHYVESFRDVAAKVREALVPGGDFVFSVEHPIFTAQGPQQWHCDESGTRLHWPVDRYFEEGARDAVFLGQTVRKRHKTLTTYIGTLLDTGFTLTGLVEPTPGTELLDSHPDMRDELRRPMMLLISARRDLQAPSPHRTDATAQ